MLQSDRTVPAARRTPPTRARRPVPDTRTARPGHGPADGRTSPPPPAEGIATTVHHVLDLLRTRRGPLASVVTHGAIERLRHFAREASDPSLRAAVHVACAHLSAGNLEEADAALTTAAHLIGPAAR